MPAFLTLLKPIVKEQIKILIIAGSLVIHNLAFAEPGDVRKIALEDGVELRIEEILDSRILPHAYYDQAISSIPGVYPDSKIIAKRRLGYLTKNPSAVYSMVCYKKSKDQKEVTISGVVTSKNKAWSFDAGVDEIAFADTLIRVMEIIADVPFNKSLQPTTE